MTQVLPSAYGHQAQVVAARFPELDAVFCELVNVEQAYLEVVHRRMNGDRFGGMLLWEEPRARVAWHLAPGIIANARKYDERRAYFDLLGAGTLEFHEKPVSQISTLDARTIIVARELAGLVTTQLFWSENERERFVARFGRRRDSSEVIAVPHVLPAFDRRKPDGPRVVIWAPDLQADITALLAFAFEEWHGEAYVICGGGELPDLRATYVRADEPRCAELLSGAALVVDASLNDPGAALAFAERNVPVLVSVTSGAHESIQDAVIYEPWSWSSVYYGALRACGRPSRLVRRSMPVPKERPAIERLTSAPLVSVVIITFNRLDELHGALESVAAQTYPNVQTIVVNDGGASVAEVCARFPRMNLKVLDRTENVKMVEAMNVGLRVGDGAYLCGLADDDRLFPDHMERLVDALEGSGGWIAHSNCLVHYKRILPDGTFYERGFNASEYIGECDPTTSLYVTKLNPTTIMVRSELYRRMGFWDSRLAYADIEIQMRMAKFGDLLHVDHFTCSWVIRDDGTNFAAEHGAGEHAVEQLNRVFEKHPVSHRPTLETMRNSLRETVRQRSTQRFFLQPTILFDPPS